MVWNRCVMVVTNVMRGISGTWSAKDRGYYKWYAARILIIFRKSRGELHYTYTGLFVKDRNPSVLWRILGEMGEVRFKENLIIRIIGQTDSSVWQEISKLA